MINIICACTNPDILPVMLRLVNDQDGWQSSSAEGLTEVIDLLTSGQKYDLILLGAGFGPEERDQLQFIIDDDGLPTKLVDHFGGGSGLLYAEVTRALDEK